MEKKNKLKYAIRHFNDGRNRVRVFKNGYIFHETIMSPEVKFTRQMIEEQIAKLEKQSEKGKV